MNRKPNILLITADQLRRDSFGTYGNRVIKTPVVVTIYLGKMPCQTESII